MRKAIFRGLGVVLCGLLLIQPAAQAATLAYNLADLGGDQWRYDYTLQLDATDPSFDQLTVYFDLPGVASITSFAAPAGWDALMAQPDTELPDAGFFDAVHQPGVFVGANTLSGFSVVFSGQRGFIPTTQRYELALSDPFQTVLSGQSVAAVPEPESYALLLAGLGLLGLVKRRSAGHVPRAKEA